MKHLHQIALLAFLLIALGLFAVAWADNHEEGDDQPKKPAPAAPKGADGHKGHDDDGDAHEPDDEKDPHAGHDHEKDGHEGEEGKDPHEGDDHEKGAPEPEAEKDPHAGHDHGDEPEGGEHVELTAEQARRIGLVLATAGPGRIARELAFPGEIVLNPDRMAHVVPPAAGIAREVLKTLGDTVEAGEILAWIESAELADAKLAFYEKEAEVGSSDLELPRARQIFENVGRLLALLEKDPTDEELRKLEGLEMGDFRGRILTAHADFVAATKTVERERTLSERAVSSGQDLVAAQAEFQRARAGFNATVDTTRYEVLVAFTAAARRRQVAEFEAVAAEQGLRLKGVDEQTIQELRGLVPKTAGLKPCLCPDPDCKDNEVPSLRAKLGADRRFGWYPLRAPFAGVVIEKHLTLGEKVGDEESVFAVADTSTVWVNFGVFQQDLVSVRPGQAVEVEVTGGGSHHDGRIAFLAPMLDPETRTARARVVLDNEGDALRPGLFVKVRVSLQTVEAAVIVPRSAVQILDEKEVIFIAEGDGFEAVPVKLGRGDRRLVEIKQGLKPGQRYVTRGAFELKAKIATSGMDAHAGHGH